MLLVVRVNRHTCRYMHKKCMLDCSLSVDSVNGGGAKFNACFSSQVRRVPSAESA